MQQSRACYPRFSGIFPAWRHADQGPASQTLPVRPLYPMAPDLIDPMPGCALPGSDATRFDEALHRLLEESERAVFVADADTGALLHANRRGRALVGRTLAEIRHLRQIDLHPAAEAEAYARRYRALADSGGMDLPGQVVVQLSGEQLAVHLSGTMLDLDGRRLAVAFMRPEPDRREVDSHAASVVRGQLMQELHDGLGQHLTSLFVRLQMLDSACAGTAQQAQARQALDLLRGTLDELRGLMRGLGPRRLDEEGLAGALRSLSRDPWPFTVRLELTEPLVAMPPRVEHAIFRTAQEALTNAARHSGAQRLDLMLIHLGDAVRLVVDDDGRGAAAEVARGRGISGIARRAAALGGLLLVDHSPGGGTMLRLDLPLTDDADARTAGR